MKKDYTIAVAGTGYNNIQFPSEREFISEDIIFDISCFIKG